jgi:uncharacterized protein
MKIVIAGSSGFIGSHLAAYFEKQGHELILLSRKPTSGQMQCWNPEANQLDPTILEGAHVVINLCGENIFGRWNQKKMEQIRKSRLDSTRLLCDTLLGLKKLPELYIGASAIGYYGDRKDEVLVESSPPGHDFLAEVCRSWEQIPEILAPKKVRVVLARLGIVLGEEGGALKHMKKAFQMGMGGILGSGKQMMSWIAIDDVCSAMQHVISHTELAGPINFVAPKAVSNLTFTQTLGKLLHRPSAFFVPKFALSLFFGEGAEMFLASADVSPQRLLDSGYPFQYPELELALKKYLSINV